MGSPSNCTSFFIFAVHDLSLYETHTPRSPPAHNRDPPPPPSPMSLCIMHCFHLCLSLFFHFVGPLFSPSVQLSPLFISLCQYFYLFLCICLSISWSVCVSFCCCPLPIYFPLLVLSLVQLCPWSAVAWLGENRSDFETGGWQPCCH